MTTSTVRVGEHDVAYRQSSGTGRPVVFVHGNSASSATWERVLAGPLGERYRCLALDLPGHGDSPALSDPDGYSLPGYAAVLAGFVEATDARDAVAVGWSLGGHIVLEAVPALADAAGLAVFGTPPVASADQLAVAFLQNPAVNIGFTPDVTPSDARAYAESFVAPGATTGLDRLVADILATDGAARGALGASLGTGRFADEVAIVRELRVPLAVLHGAEEQLVSLGYLRGLTMPTLWRDAVQVMPGVGHAPQEEAPEAFADLLGQFIADLS